MWLCDAEPLLFLSLDLSCWFVFLWLVPENIPAAWEGQRHQEIEVISLGLQSHKKIECVLFLLLYKSWTNMTWILQQYIPILKAAGGFWSPFVQNIFCSMPRERNREENRWGEFFCSSCQLGESILFFQLAKHISPKWLCSPLLKTLDFSLLYWSVLRYQVQIYNKFITSNQYQVNITNVFLEIFSMMYFLLTKLHPFHFILDGPVWSQD